MEQPTISDIFRRAAKLVDRKYQILAQYCSCDCVFIVCDELGIDSNPLILGYQKYLMEMLYEEEYIEYCKDAPWSLGNFSPNFFSRNDNSQEMRVNALLSYADYLEKQNEPTN